MLGLYLGTIDSFGPILRIEMHNKKIVINLKEMKMKNTNAQKVHQSARRLHNRDNENDFRSSQTSLGFALDKYERMEKDLEDARTLAILKDDSRFNDIGTDADLDVDIQDAIGRESSLSLVADNIVVTVEGEIVTLEGEVYREEEKMTAGDIATTFAGEDNVNNYLRIIDNGD